MATRIIWCKSFGTGKLFTRILLRKKTRLLLDLLDDADRIDLLHMNRLQELIKLVEQSPRYKVGYRILAWWNFHTKHLNMKTDVAKKYLLEILKTFVDWMETHIVQMWHKKQYGARWMQKTLTCARKTLHTHLQTHAT